MSKKAETAQLVLKFPDASDATIARLRTLLKHYTGKLITKTECVDSEDDEEGLELNAEPETVTTAELTVKLNDAAAYYFLEKILDIRTEVSIKAVTDAVKSAKKGA